MLLLQLNHDKAHTPYGLVRTDGPEATPQFRELLPGFCCAAVEQFASVVLEVMSEEPLSQVGLGTHVEIELIDSQGNREPMAFDLVAENAADIDQRRLGANTPLAKAIRGKTVGNVIPYRMGDIVSIRIVTVQPSNVDISEDAAERRRAILAEARRKAEKTNADMFASSFSGKWGDYNTVDSDE
jgi:hypothetical protein